MRHLRLILLLVLLPAGSGCGLFFRNTIETPSARFWSNSSIDEISGQVEIANSIIEEYRQLFWEFSPEVLRPEILYEEESLSRQNIYTEETRQEGYYLPAFDLVHLKPRRPRGEEDDRTVFLHELAHHFLISGYPDTADRYWLNEGFACCLEISFFDDDGSLVTPLFHPRLYQEARHLRRELGEIAFTEMVGSLITARWQQFHRGEEKMNRYAVSWSLFWFLLDSAEGSLQERLATVVSLDDLEVSKRLPELARALSVGIETRLARICSMPELRRWALGEWLEVPWPDGSRLRPILETELEENPGDPEVWKMLAQLANRPHRRLSSRDRINLHSRIREQLELGSAAIKIALCEQIAEGARTRRYTTALIDLLEDADGAIRAAAARALARLFRKPTIISPVFWKNAPEEKRQAEVVEWREWIAD
ncbi:MAG TPA: hypothetical protein EYN79_01980 [Planctomycetes bacterium]|nr:hypothetical protein [Planctomycetota bacterium]HIN81061.1 hypothetical protein [Planctomycetota bacterium]